VRFMAAIEEGRICVKTMGKDSGDEVTITKVVDRNFVMVKDAKGKESRVSIRHLEPTSRKE
jgi:large subunit ribosomal protein L14e